MTIVRITLLVVFCAAASFAQEVAFVDLTTAGPFTPLRRPARNPNDRPLGSSQTIRECRAVDPKAGSLKTSLVVLDRNELRAGDEPLFQVQVENVGTVPVEMPVSTHVEALQPDNTSKSFTYLKAEVVLWIGGKNWYSNTAGSATVVGDEGHPGTTVTLHPGEWVRIAGKGRIGMANDDEIKRLVASGDKPDRLFARTVIYRDTTNVTATTTETASQGTCVNQIEGAGRPIQFAAQ